MSQEDLGIDLLIDIEGWAVYDGRFDLENDREFEVCLYTKGVNKSNTGKSIIQIEPGFYKIQGEILYSGYRGWVIDCGIRLYSLKTLDSSFKVGDYIVCEASLGFDPMYDVYDLNDRREWPCVTYKWDVIKKFQIISPYEDSSTKLEKIIEIKSKEDYVWCDDYENFFDSYQIVCRLKDNKNLENFELHHYVENSEKLFLDDKLQAPEGWTRCYWPNQVISYLNAYVVTELSLDYDLGDHERGTGLDVLIWIEEQVTKSNFYPPKITVHSAPAQIKIEMIKMISKIENLKNINLETIHDNMMKGEVEERVKLAGYTDLSKKTISKLMDDESKSVVCTLASNPCLPELYQTKLSEIKDVQHILLALAGNPNLSLSLIERFSKIDDDALRQELMSNPSVSDKFKSTNGY
ncbi:cyclic-phosphate processing receiver domain-containing protein [Endozoicomonas lisbonensis]|uniref:Cyclic-phosphate processing Receiver domain-containing protein n=1 Tax=Endozoicomonas lisbonensis TaxID=3120522 RepID=A0ABV2SL50_9GAMM